MKNLTHSMSAKVAAIFLSAINMLLLVLISVGIYQMAINSFYISSFDGIRNNVESGIAQEYAYDAYREYINGYDPVEYFKNRNFYFVIADSDGRELASNYNGEKVQFSVTAEFDYGKYKVYGFIGEYFYHTDKVSTVVMWLERAYSLRYIAIAVDFAVLIVFLLLIVFLFFSAGYGKDDDTPQLGTFGKIPFDILTFFLALLVLLQSTLLSGIYDYWLRTALSLVLLMVDFLLFLGYAMNFAVRIKLGNLLSSLVVTKVAVVLFSGVKSFFGALSHLAASLPIVWKTFLAMMFIIIIEALALNTFSWRSGFTFFWLIEKAILLPVVLFFAASLRTVQKSGKAIAEGNFDYIIDTKYLTGDIKQFAYDLQSINDGMHKAIDTKMRSERLKTELITNVSHDIKTPLTSIINYVDLIKKENISSEKVTGYVEVLDRQSVRLKKLIEDLVEASKASTGNLTVNLEKCNIDVMLDQAIAEYDERLQKNKLELIQNRPLFPVYIMADGRYLWRIFDNLLNNICKYAQPLTRVYLDSQVIGENSVITFRNISKYPLNISSEELMERFVRGDVARNTEGNGLGLSIARSLAEVQNGTLELEIDGDLFKASLKFKTVEEIV